MTERFGLRLQVAMEQHGPLCVGIDPHPPLLQSWGLPETVDGLREFALRSAQAMAGHVSIVKPQSAFFERFGAPGVAVLTETLQLLRDAGTLTLLDVKRGDIGSTMTAYAQTHLGPQAPVPADAITVSPYLGVGALGPAFELAHQVGGGVFVLALTSNPQGAQVQHARAADGRTVAGLVIDDVSERNAATADGRFGDVGLVVGATMGKDIADLGLLDQLAESRAPLLAPGLGAQGATEQDLADGFGAAGPLVLASSSRAILAAGPEPAQIRAAIAATAGVLASALG